MKDAAITLLFMLMFSSSLFCSNNNDANQLTQLEDYNTITHDQAPQSIQSAIIHRTQTEIADYNQTDTNSPRYPVTSRTNAIQRLPQQQNNHHN